MASSPAGSAITGRGLSASPVSFDSSFTIHLRSEAALSISELLFQALGALHHVIDAAAQFAGFLEGDPWAGPERGTGGL